MGDLLNSPEKEAMSIMISYIYIYIEINSFLFNILEEEREFSKRLETEREKSFNDRGRKRDKEMMKTEIEERNKLEIVKLCK